MPDGSQVKVGFSLAFAQSPHAPKVAYFVCENRAQQYFWKSEYQSHANGATGITAVYLSSPDPMRDAAFVGKMFGGEIEAIADGYSVACGVAQELRVLTPQAISQRDKTFTGGKDGTCVLAGIAVTSRSPGGQIPSADANGMFIEWVPM